MSDSFCKHLRTKKMFTGATTEDVATSRRAKGVVNGFYGSAARYSYWNGCSTGGRQAFTEAQRYPGDYDGIIAGAPAAYVTRLQGIQVWISQQANRSPASLIPAEKFSLIHNAVLAACDGLDGVKDGVLENPTKR